MKLMRKLKKQVEEEDEKIEYETHDDMCDYLFYFIFKPRLDLGTDTDRSVKSPDSTMTESTRLKIQKLQKEKVCLIYSLKNLEKI